MKALKVHELKGPDALVLEDVASPEPKAGQIRLKVEACGINFFDSLVLVGKYQQKPELPFGPGGEVCGRVDKLGAGVTGFSPGERVIGLPFMNGCAEEAIVSAATAVPVPDDMNSHIAAGFPIAYQTAYLSLATKANLQPGETAVIHGAGGGVGLAAVEVAKCMGAQVIATASTSDKLDLARAHGADHVINSREDDIRESVKALTGGHGAEVIYDPVGGDIFDVSLRCVRLGVGRIVIVGFAAGRIPQIPANILLVKNVDVLGLNRGHYVEKDTETLRAGTEELLRWYSQGALKPHVSKVFSLEEGAEAIRWLSNRKAQGKVVVVP